MLNFAQMISIIEHIEYLMTRNDCVVVPGWGAFIAQYVPACFSVETSQFRKPMRNVSFNASVIHNDGLLVNSITRRHGLTFAEATKLIGAHVAVCRQLINEGSEVPFGRLGYFVPIGNGGVEFIPFAKEHCCDGYFGLKSYEFVPLTEWEEATQEQPAAVTASQPPPLQRGWWGRRAIQLAASIVVLIGLGLVLSTPIAMSTREHQLATLNVPDVKKQADTGSENQSLEPHRADFAIKRKADTMSRRIKPSPVASRQVIDPEQRGKAKATATPGNKGKYYLVICTLSSQKQVNSFFASEKRFKNAKVRKKGKQYRIYIERGDDYSALMKKAQNLPEPYQQGWVTTD